MKQKKIPLSLQIFLALGLGIAVGMAFTGNPTFAVSYIKPFGTIFLNLLKFVVVPIVFFSILSCIISISDIRKVGSIGVKTLVYYTPASPLSPVRPPASWTRWWTSSPPSSSPPLPTPPCCR